MKSKKETTKDIKKKSSFFGSPFGMFIVQPPDFEVKKLDDFDIRNMLKKTR